MDSNRRAFLGMLLGAAVAPARGEEAGAPRRGWPSTVTQPEPELISLGDSAAGAVFQTERFEFVVEGGASPGLMRAFARCAEGTRRLWRALPLELPPDNPGEERALVRVLKNDTSYQAAGGPKGTAGRFQSRPGGRPTLLVNAEQMGVDTFNGRAAMGAAYRPSLLIHELSHLATSAWMPWIPFWLSEGLAEYGALIPYKDGVFRLDAESLRGALRKRSDFLRAWREGDQPSAGLSRWILPLAVLFDQDRTDAMVNSLAPEPAHRVYFTALLLTFYFMHLDPPTTPGGARPLAAYLAGVTADAAREKAEPRRRRRGPPGGFRGDDGAERAAAMATLFRGKSPAELEKSMRAAFAGLRVSLA